ncbi:MAG: DUF1801 domain-containing protein [Prevotellaceae bacterium]|jgi:uncharacterized protein YdhG (YjbR/CyaY superfamily)|nr:DUF1801 domain-containing protein [Prevotellaceae bacterium]
MGAIDTVEKYIAQFPPEIGEKLESIRRTILATEPKIKEAISWNMPGYKLCGKPLVYFAGHKNHIGFYPAPSGVEAFDKELSIYKKTKGAVQFPYKQPLPLDLIARIVRFRANEVVGSKKV